MNVFFTHAKNMLSSTDWCKGIRRVGVSTDIAPSPDRDDAVSLPLAAVAMSYTAPLRAQV